jgi:hypothetical protein
MTATRDISQPGKDRLTGDVTAAAHPCLVMTAHVARQCHSQPKHSDLDEPNSALSSTSLRSRIRSGEILAYAKGNRRNALETIRTGPWL